MRITSSITNILLILVICLNVVIGSFLYFNSDAPKGERHMHGMIKGVTFAAGLSLVRANFSEVFSSKDFTYFDMPGLRRQVFIYTEAEAVAGFNLDSLQIEIEEEKKRINITKMPFAKIQHVSYDFNYYNLTSDLFAEDITSEFLNQQQEEIKEVIAIRIDESGITGQAEMQFIDRIETLNAFAEPLGWMIKITDKKWLD